MKAPVRKKVEDEYDSNGNRPVPDEPYTVIGHSCLLPSFHFFLDGEGLKKIVKQMKDDEDLSITVGDTLHNDGTVTYWQRIEIVDTHNKYHTERPR